MVSHKSILTRFLLSTLLIMLIAGGTTVYLSHISNRDAISDMARQLRIERSKYVQRHLEAFLVEPQRVLSEMAERMKAEGPGLHGPLYWEETFLNLSLTYDSFASLYFGNVDGGIVLGGHDGTGKAPYFMATDDFVAGTFRKFAAEANGERGKQLLELPNFDARTRPWYRAAQADNDRGWGDIYVLFTGQDMSLPAVRPVHDDAGNFLGVLGADVFMFSLREFLAELHRTNEGLTYIIDEKGYLVASSTGEVPFLTDGAGRPTGERLAARDSGIPLVRESARALDGAIARPGATGGPDTLRVRVEGREETFEVASFKDLRGLNWSIVTIIPDKILMERVYAGNRTVAMLTAAALIVLAAAAFFLTRSITVPLGRLGSAARAVADGDFDQKIDIRRQDEIGDLAASFNRMISHLRELFREREIALEQAETNAARLRDFAKSSSDWFWEMDADLRFTYFSSEQSGKAALPGRTGLGERRWDFADPTDRTTDWEAHKALLYARKPFRDFEYPIVGHSGRVWLSVSGVPIFDEAGTFVGYRGSSADISMRKADEIRLRLQGEIIEILSEGVNATRLSDGILVYTNSQFDQIFGYRQGEMVGKHVSCLNAKTDESPEEIADRINGIVLEEGGWHGEVLNLRKDGSAFWCEVSIARMDHPEHGPIGITVRTDITDRKESEERLRRAQRMEAVGQLTGGIAHDFNNLLAILLGNAELLEEQVDADSQAMSSVAVIKRTVERGAALTGRLLAFSRRQVLAPVDADIMEILRDIEEMLRRTLGEDVDLGIFGDEVVWPARVDVGQFENAIVNLAINSRQAMPRTGELKIVARNVSATTIAREFRGDSELSPGDYVAISVSDTGSGMTPEVISRAFEPFFTTKEVGKGSGLGLSMVYGFVKQSGGTVTIESTPGEGTCVTLYLPRAEAQPLPHKDPEPQQVEGGSERILVVEDDPLVRENIVGFLKAAGYRVNEAADAEEGLAIAQRGEPPELLFTDVVLPGSMSGPELAAKLSAIYPEMRVLLASGYPRDSFGPSRALPPGAQFLRKPFRKVELLKTVRSCLDGAFDGQG